MQLFKKKMLKKSPTFGTNILNFILSYFQTKFLCNHIHKELNHWNLTLNLTQARTLIKCTHGSFYHFSCGRGYALRFIIFGILIWHTCNGYNDLVANPRKQFDTITPPPPPESAISENYRNSFAWKCLWCFALFFKDINTQSNMELK